VRGFATLPTTVTSRAGSGRQEGGER
jgi:hypothetical protein